ncbi:MAG: YlzJ-like family protein [Tumebacillaceae bacterium]
MLNWSIIPEEFVFDGVEKCGENWIEIDVRGVKMIVEPGGMPGYGKVVRLLSPNPQHYLNPSYQPGQTICLFG